MQIQKSVNWSTPQIELFMLNVDDVTEKYVAWLNDPLVNRYLESRFMLHTIQSTQAFVNNCVLSDHILLLGIRCIEFENSHVGNIKLEINKQHMLGEVGILVGEKKVHGKGIGTQAINLLSEIAHSEFKLRKLSAGCYTSNKASERAFTKAGFIVEGVRSNHFLLNREQCEGLTLMGKLL